MLYEHFTSNSSLGVCNFQFSGEECDYVNQLSHVMIYVIIMSMLSFSLLCL